MEEAKEATQPFETPARPAAWLLWGGVVLTALTLMAVFALTRMIQAQNERLPVISQLPDFALTDQQGRSVTLASLSGQVWIADIIFTRCAGPCLQMTKRMSQLQAVLPGQAPVKLVTLTTDPAFDTPAGKALYFERVQKELNLTPAQAQQMESILNDMWLYYRTVLSDSKSRVDQVLTDEQRKKFERLLEEQKPR